MEPFELTACAALDKMKRKEMSATELVASCLGRIEQLEPQIGAWAYLASEAALARAKELDSGAASGPLHGLPIGIKDVLDTGDMPSEYGSPIFKDFRPRVDASCVAIARRQGAIVLGKTITQALACGGPVKTANPLNIRHTSGGSSSGSAASVAAKMVPFALGSQSASSVIRPASYCGLVGLRPTLGLISVAGFKYFNGSFDTIGLLGRDVDDVELFWSALLDTSFDRGAMPERPPVIAVCRPPWLAAAEPSAWQTVDRAEEKFRLAGVEVCELELPAGYEDLLQLQARIQLFEQVRSFAAEYDQYRHLLDDNTLNAFERGRTISVDEYLEMVKRARQARHEFDQVIGDADCIATAAAPGEAPLGWHALGDKFREMGGADISRAWTLLHLPTVTVPCHRGPAGMPVGIQLIGRFGEDRHLLRVARWAQEALAS